MKKLFFLLGAVLCLFFSSSLLAQPGTITTIAGNGSSGYTGDGGPAVSAQLFQPSDIAFDTAGSIYIADAFNNCIRKVNSSGIISTIAGTGAMGYSGDGGPATVAKLSHPTALAFDISGNLYIADWGNCRIRKINSFGVISTFAGNGLGGHSGDGGPATLAKLLSPIAIAFDDTGNLYISEEGNSIIRKVSYTGIISTFAGIGTFGYSGDGGLATAAEFNGVSTLAIDHTGNMYIADCFNNCIRKINSSGIISTIAGTGISGYSGDGGPAIAAQLNRPYGIDIDNSGNLFISESDGSRIRKISVTGIISSLAGDGTCGLTGDGGPATAATICGPQGIKKKPSGEIYIAELFKHRIRRICDPPTISIISGATMMCEGNLILLSDTSVGGVWSSGDSSIATVTSTGIVTAVSGGSVVITYSKSNSCSTTTTYHSITINPLPNAGAISGIDSLCQNDIITFTSIITGGLWTSTDTSVALIDSTGVVLGVNTGNTSISYSVTNSCGTAIDTMLVTISPSPNAGTITGSSVVCFPAVTTLASTGTSGTWSSSTSHATVVGGVVSGVSAGNTIISYSVTNGCGTAIDTMLVTINPSPNAGTITGSSVVCFPAVITLSSTATGGTWSSSTSHATVSGGVVSGVSAGNTIISYSVTNGCGTAIDTMMVSITQTPDAGIITGSSVVCITGSVTLTNVAAGGIWNSSSPAITMTSGGVVTGVDTGTAIITYSVSNSCGSAATTTSIIVYPMPVVGLIAGDDNVCVGEAAVFSNAYSGGSWISSNPGVAAVSGATISGVSAGSATISYMLSNSCGSAVTTKPLTVMSLTDCNALGIATTKAEQTINVYPNPTTGSFVVDLLQPADNVTVTVMDVTGKILQIVKPTGSATQIPVSLSNVASGTYMIKVEADGITHRVKMVVW